MPKKKDDSSDNSSSGSGSSSGSDSDSDSNSSDNSNKEEAKEEPEEVPPPQLTFSMQTLKQMFSFARQAIKQTKQRIDMTRIEKIGGDAKNPLVHKK